MSKKKTHEEYVAELAVKNPNIEVIGEYVNANTKIMHHCLAHDVYWKIKPLNILNGQGCEFCRREKIKNSRSKTHEEYVRELKKINPNIIVIEKYRGATISILHECIKHNIQWRISPSDTLHGNGCKVCKSEKIREKLSKTNEQYVEELKTKNPNIISIEEYMGANTPILHECLLDKHKWKARPANLLNGHSGCPKCSQRFRRTNSDYIEELSIKNPSIESLENFKGMSTPILHKCKIHNVKWVVSPDNILRGHGCKECGKDKTRDKNCKTHEEYVGELEIVNQNIKVIGTYKGANIPILHKCLIDNFEWNAQPLNILSGKGCPKCANNFRRTQEEYIRQLSVINPNIEVIGKYKNIHTRILHKCKTHGIQWNTSPASVLQGSGCIQCSKEKISNALKKTHDEYIEDLSRLNPNIVVIDNYKGALTPILHRCLKCENTWYVSPANVLSGTGCPQCYESKGERKIRLWLDRKHIEYKTQKKFNDCCDIKPLPFDFYLPTFNIAIEYQGKQHYEPIEYFGGQEKFELQQKHDKIKNEYCKNNGISLLCIPYYKNIEEELNNFLFI